MNDKVQELLDKFDRDDDDMLGALVFDMKTGEQIASTFSKKYGYPKDIIEIEQSISELEKNKILKIDPAGVKTWSMHSFSKKLIGLVRVRGDIFLSVEYVLQKSPSGGVEDMLEVALMVNYVL